MGTISRPPKVKLFAGLITSRRDTIEPARKRLAAEFGPTDVRSATFSFDSTDYYDEEMGKPLLRLFWSFDRLIEPDRLAAVKVRTNEIEAEMAKTVPELKRPINIDPGYLEESKLVLASTKNFAHRIYLAQGIYAEVTQVYQDRGWRSLPWTFPDFRAGSYDGFFDQARRLYRGQLGK